MRRRVADTYTSLKLKQCSMGTKCVSERRRVITRAASNYCRRLHVKKWHVLRKPSQLTATFGGPAIRPYGGSFGGSGSNIRTLETVTAMKFCCAARLSCVALDSLECKLQRASRSLLYQAAGASGTRTLANGPLTRRLGECAFDVRGNAELRSTFVNLIMH